MTGDPSESAPTVRIERRIAAAPSWVYAAWTDGRLMSRWMSPFGSAAATADPRVGGRLSVVMVDAGVRLEHHGEYLQLDPPRRIQFTWRSPYTNGPSLVTVVLRPDGDGTWLTLTHERLPADVVSAHVDGWNLMLDRLEDRPSRRQPLGRVHEQR